MDGTGTLKLRVVRDPNNRDDYYRYNPEQDQFEFRYTTLGGWIVPYHDLLQMNPAFIRLMADLKADPYVTTAIRPRVKRIWGCDYRFVNGRFEVRVDDGEWEPSDNTLGHPCMGEHLDAYHELMHNPTEVIEDHGEEVEA